MGLKRIDTDQRLAALEAVYGEGAWEIAKAEKSRRDKALNNIALAGNAASTVAGPAAIYSAVRAARTNQGGIPRDVATGLGNKLRASSNPRAKAAGVRIKRSVNALNYGKGTRGRMTRGAAAAGGTMVALQGINVGTDALSTKLLADQNKKKDKVAKSERPRPLERQGKLVRIAVESGPVVATKTKAGALKVADQVRDRDFKFKAEGRVSKADNDKRQVYGWVSVTEINGEPVVDRQGDYVHIDVIEKAAHDYLASSRKGGDMHVRVGDQPKHVSDLIESFVVTDEKKKILGLPESTPTGWWCGFQVHDDATWELVKKGDRPMFSIHGSGRRISKSLDEIQR